MKMIFDEIPYGLEEDYGFFCNLDEENIDYKNVQNLETIEKSRLEREKNKKPTPIYIEKNHRNTIQRTNIMMLVVTTMCSMYLLYNYVNLHKLN